MAGGLKLGIQKTTLLDYPGEVACTLFFSGCNFRCPYCHNPELLSGSPPAGSLTLMQIADFLEKRKSVLGGVCITGGEPLLSPCLDEVISMIKSKGLKIKLDTNGSFPQKLADSDVDFIAMDIKTSPDKYELLGGSAGKDRNKVLESIKIIMDRKISHEFRTTVVPDLVDTREMWEISRLIEGAAHYALAQYSPQKTLDPLYANVRPYSAEKLKQLSAIPAHLGIPVSIRGI
ncbi:MAG: anaerobic ribonucleoside-triphosphate reductase activating protein [Spirochaetales bacterium]|nr:anaerobic ribonucleoside-triphosphate reductase activating protein [Spirochaetales bacterium]